MNETVKQFVLTGDKFTLEMYLIQLGIIYSACWPFTINKKRIQKFKETDDSQCIYQNELDKSCFHHDMGHRDF